MLTHFFTYHVFKTVGLGSFSRSCFANKLQTCGGIFFLRMDEAFPAAHHHHNVSYPCTFSLWGDNWHRCQVKWKKERGREPLASSILDRVAVDFGPGFTLRVSRGA